MVNSHEVSLQTFLSCATGLRKCSFISLQLNGTAIFFLHATEPAHPGERGKKRVAFSFCCSIKTACGRSEGLIIS